MSHLYGASAICSEYMWLIKVAVLIWKMCGCWSFCTPVRYIQQWHLYTNVNVSAKLGNWLNKACEGNVDHQLKCKSVKNINPNSFYNDTVRSCHRSIGIESLATESVFLSCLFTELFEYINWEIWLEREILRIIQKVLWK